MTGPDDQDQRAARDGARRLLVLWVCWLALAGFLFAAGVVGFV